MPAPRSQDRSHAPESRGETLRFPDSCALRRALKEYADATYGVGKWVSVALVVTTKGGRGEVVTVVPEARM